MNISLPLLPAESCYKTEKTLFKLVSTLSSLDIIKELCSKHELISGMKQRRASWKIDFNTETYKKLVYPRLGISPYTLKEDIEKKQITALQYANILKQYKPDDFGELNENFTYYELVFVVEKVFKQHMTDPRKLLHVGYPVYSTENKFFAKVNRGQVFIIHTLGKILGEGTTGTVIRVYEIASRQFLALKYARLDKETALDEIQVEVAHLKKLHHRLSLRAEPLDGFQDQMLADFYLPEIDLVGYLSPQYEIDLFEWAEKKQATSLERLAICKALMKICLNLNQLGLWHGDIKPENIMLKNQNPVVIDWTGMLSFDDAAAKFILPRFQTSEFLNLIDAQLLNAMKQRKNPFEKNEFLEAAKSLELFSFAITLYWVLTSKMPFDEAFDPLLKRKIPITKEGLNLLPLQNYSPEVIFIMTKMLAHDPKDRFNIEEAVSAWEKIEENPI